MQCPRCDFENAETSQYCRRCGTPLHIVTPSSQPQEPYPLSPSSREYGTPLSPTYGMQSEFIAHQKIFPSRPGLTVFRVMRSILYFIASCIAAFGLIGTFNALFGTGTRAEGLAIFFALGLLVGAVVIFVFLRERVPQLQLAHFIWGALGATVGMIMAFILEYALAPKGVFYDLFFGLIVLLYGFVLAAICLW